MAFTNYVMHLNILADTNSTSNRSKSSEFRTRSFSYYLSLGSSFTILDTLQLQLTQHRTHQMLPTHQINSHINSRSNSATTPPSLPLKAPDYATHLQRDLTRRSATALREEPNQSAPPTYPIQYLWLAVEGNAGEIRTSS